MGKIIRLRFFLPKFGHMSRMEKKDSQVLTAGYSV